MDNLNDVVNSKVFRILMPSVDSKIKDSYSRRVSCKSISVRNSKGV
jgi:hypothetical protein